MELIDSMEMDKLSYEIFSILEKKFLFGGDCYDSLPQTTVKAPINCRSDGGKVRILSIDGGVGSSSDGLLAGAALSRLESSLRSRSGDPNARIADFFDVAAGSGAGGVLVAMLFTRGTNGRPLFSADEALRCLAENRRGIASASRKGIFRGIFRRSGGGIFRRTFGEATLRDTVKPVLIPCYDLSTGAPFVFSRADAMETDGYDFKMSHVCAATCADRATKMRSADGKTWIVAVGGGVAMGNPTSAAITHVLNNKQEFPFASGVEDLLVVSLGSGDLDCSVNDNRSATPSREELLNIAGNSAADTVDQAVAMAFGPHRTTNYVRIQANRFLAARSPVTRKAASGGAAAAEEMLSRRNVESVLFRGKKISELSNAKKLEKLSEELIKEQQRRKSSPIPTVLIKQAMTPRSSSVTTCTTTTTTTPSSIDRY